jgi:hypothetical protein
LWNGLIWLRAGYSGGLFENSNETSSSIQGGEYLYQQSTDHALKDSAPWEQNLKMQES